MKCLKHNACATRYLRKKRVCVCPAPCRASTVTATTPVATTCRCAIPGARARELGSFYADGEFDLTRLQHLRDETVEIGRSCVHPDYRSGTTIARLWSGLVVHTLQHDCRYMMGCASLSMADGGQYAASVYLRLMLTALSPTEYRVFPRCALPVDALAHDSKASPPPLVKGYIRVGAYVCGAPAWDSDFNTADLLMLLPMSRMDARYARHLLKD